MVQAEKGGGRAGMGIKEGKLLSYGNEDDGLQ